MSRTNISPLPATPNSLFPVSLSWGLETLSVGALVDSGADECLMDVTLARQAGVLLEPMDTTLAAQALDGHLLGKISHRTIPISLTISGNHTEEIRFFIIRAPAAPLVLGRPWTCTTPKSRGPRDGFWAGAMRVTPRACAPPILHPVRRPHPPSLLVPPIYHDLARVFSKEQALSLPPSLRLRY